MHKHPAACLALEPITGEVNRLAVGSGEHSALKHVTSGSASTNKHKHPRERFGEPDNGLKHE